MILSPIEKGGKVIMKCVKCGEETDYYRDLCARCELTREVKPIQQRIKARKAR